MARPILLALSLAVGGDGVRIVRSRSSSSCTKRTQEYEVDLKVADFRDRDAGVKKFRDLLESLEDDVKSNWGFKHKGSSGEDPRTQYAAYLDLPGKNLLSKHSVQFRYRQALSGGGKDDFVVKYKQTNGISNLRPLGPDKDFEDDYSCKVEENFKYTSRGIELEFEEQAAKVKDLDDDFLQSIRKLGDIDDIFSDVRSDFNLGSSNTRLSVATEQYRWIIDEVELEIGGEKVESSFVLWYRSKNDMDAGRNPYMGAWSFKLEKGEKSWGVQDEAEKVLDWVGKNM